MKLANFAEPGTFSTARGELQQRCREDVLKLKALRTQIRTGVEALKPGEYIESAEPDLDAYLERFKIALRRRAR